MIRVVPATIQVAQFVTILLTAVGMALSLAHALELPGKRRLARQDYLTVQTIYCPGFTIGGFFGEPLAILATLALVLITPVTSLGFWLALAALVCLFWEHGIYWLLVHPVNKAWLAREQLSTPGAVFFESGRRSLVGQEWTALRDLWEYSHLVRAFFAALAFVLVLFAALRPA